MTPFIYFSATHTVDGLGSSADALKVNAKVSNFDLYRFGVVNHFTGPLQEVPCNFFTFISFFKSQLGFRNDTKVRRQLAGVSDLRLPRGSHGANSGLWAWRISAFAY